MKYIEMSQKEYHILIWLIWEDFMEEQMYTDMS